MINHKISKNRAALFKELKQKEEKKKKEEWTNRKNYKVHGKIVSRIL